MTVAEVNVVAQAFHDAVANQDAAALAELYHEDARFMPPNMPPAEGRPAIQQAMQQLLDMGARSLEIEPLDVRECGDMTIEYGRYALGLEVPTAGGARRTAYRVADGGRLTRRQLHLRRGRALAGQQPELGGQPRRDRPRVRLHRRRLHGVRQEPRLHPAVGHQRLPSLRRG